MAAEKDVGALKLFRHAAGFRAVDPRPYLGCREQELARGPRAGHLTGSGKVIDLSLLDPEKFGQFPDREKLMSIWSKLIHDLPSGFWRIVYRLTVHRGLREEPLSSFVRSLRSGLVPLVLSAEHVRVTC